jgi:hypothetical protein
LIRPAVVARAQSAFAFLWQRFLLLGWIGRVVAVIVALYATGWIVGQLGMRGMGRQLGSAALFVLSLLLTALIIRWVWRNYTAPPRR